MSGANVLPISLPPSDRALNSKFLIVFAFIQDKVESCASARWGAVFEGLFDFAVERDSPELECNSEAKTLASKVALKLP